ncbi:helix-turn-helix transcriptional regulator [Leptospira sp. GIMC2001]|uniref:helix-turn-helix transcriptional regulator n=1 Tax=Leptospira sp. GIMC2001 TaxID=1513297 RepID=UPI002349F8B6|nr:WYL domain-containing protein [Leptospira sp. GIMC2001]WCL49284.1 WYL domain-containing protein [Leptospira sp. GIMC2001]
MQEDIELGIDPYPINDTESRLITLLFTLLKYPQGLTYQRIRSYIPDHYNNENQESDQKKLHRDMEELSKLGFPAYFHRETNTYHVDGDTPESKLQFSHEELESLSMALISKAMQEGGNFKSANDFEIKSLAQKVFGGNTKIHTEFHKKIWTNHKQNLSSKVSESEEDDSQNDTITETILYSIKSKIPIKIQYERKYGIPVMREIDPVQLIRKNSQDFYLYAFDREKLDYRNFLIPCITKIIKLETNFFKNHATKKPFQNFHPLMFPFHDPIEIEIKIQESYADLLKDYLNSVDFQSKQNIISFKSTNSKAIFAFLLKNENIILGLEPKSVRDEYELYLNKISSLHKTA